MAALLDCAVTRMSRKRLVGDVSTSSSVVALKCRISHRDTIIAMKL